MKVVLVLFFIVLMSNFCFGQYYQFSQYNFTDQRINPATVAASDYATINFLYRNQKTGGDFNLNSSYFSVAYPFLSQKTGKRWSGIGLSLIDDRTGGVYNTQEASLSYAANIYLSRYQTLSLGAKGLYQQRRINLDGLYTGLQYIPDRGFDDGMFSGEGFQYLNNNFFTLSLGGYWQQVDRKQNRISYLSFSFFDFNKPQDSFLETNSQLRSTFVGAFGFRAYQQGPLSVFPEALFTNGYNNSVLNIGAITQYEIRQAKNVVAARVDIITKYVIGRSGIIGFQIHKDNFAVGISYDFPVISKNYGNTGALEFGVILKRLVDSKLKKRSAASKKNPNKSDPSDAKKVEQKTSTKPINKILGDSTSTVRKGTTLKETIQSKQDSVNASANVGDIKHTPVVLEKATLYFNFDFNSSKIDGESAAYLNELASVLIENNMLRITLTGHTDNIGSDKFNLRLSKERALAVKDYLIEQGVNPDKIIADGKGLSEPLNENKTDEDRAKNRRVDLNIIYEQE